MSDEPTYNLDPPRDATVTRASDGYTRDPDAPPASRDEPPDIPGYERLKEVGRGGMGVVYRAREVAFDRSVAVKVLQGRFPPGSTGARRFLAEARITAQLAHPAIPPVHHIGTLPDGRPFLAMKLIDGDNLSDLLAADPDDLSRFVPVFAQVCQGVGFAHSKGIIHRDLKPANIMVGAFGEVQVMDWGLAKQVRAPEPDETQADDPDALPLADEDGPADATQAGSVLGTPAYMSPEQAAGRVDLIDERADVFGLGAVLCAILTGQPPYTGQTVLSVCAQAVGGETDEAFDRLDGCGADRELVALCKRCLAADRNDRPRDAGAVARAVTAHLAEAERRARQAELNRVRAEEGRKRRRVRRALAAAVLGLVGVAALGALLAGLWRRAEGERETADFHRARAEDEKRAADVLRAEADRQRANARQYLYLSRVGLAGRAWNDSQVHRMGELLEAEQDHPAAADPRRFEWHYLWRIYRGGGRVIRGHTEAVRAVAWRPDGKRLATGSRDGTVRVWEADTPGPALVSTPPTAGDVHAVCWSPDGKRLASSSTELVVRVWDAETGRLLNTLTGHANFVLTLDWSSDGERLASGSWDGTARVWNTRTWESVVCRGHTNNVDGVAFSPDGGQLATGSADATVRVWDAATGRPVRTITGHAGGVAGVCWSSDGKRVASASSDRTARVWEVATGRELAALRGHTHSVHRVASDPAGRVLASASGDGTVRLWEGAGRPRSVLRGHTGLVTDVEFSPDGRRLATASFDGTARVWDADTDQDSAAFRGHTGWVWATAFSPDGQYVASASQDGTVRVRDAGTGRERFPPLRLGGSVHALAYSPDGRWLVTGSADRTVRVWDAATGRPERILALGGAVWSVAVSPDGKHLAAATGQTWYFPANYRLLPPDIKVWRVDDWREVASLRGHTGLITDLAFSTDGRRVATASYDKTVRLWDVPSGREVRVLRWAESWPSALAFRPGGRELAVGAQDGAMSVWDADDGRELRRFRAHTEDVFSVAYSPDGTRLVSTSHDASLKLWEPDSGTELLVLKAHTGGVTTAAFSPDGRRLVSGSQDNAVRVWDGTPPAAVGRE